MAWVYKIENKINHKVYIGKTYYTNPETRWKQHQRDYLNHQEKILYRAFKKYGIDNFLFSVLEETNSPEEREVYYIEKFNSYVGFSNCQGYNMTLGGDGERSLDYEYIKDFYLEHRDWSFEKIAAEIGIDRNSIPVALRYFNLKHEPSDEEVIEYYLNNDVNQRETAEHFYMSNVYVNRVLKRNNIKSKTEKDFTHQDIINKYLSDPQITQKEVADFFGLYPNSVSRILCKYGISKPRPKPKKKDRGV